MKELFIPRNIMPKPELRQVVRLDERATSASTGTTYTVPSAKELLYQINAAMASIARCEENEPFRRHMLSLGYDPRDGWVMVLPRRLIELPDSSILPPYVKESDILNSVVFINTGALKPQPPTFEL